jgi:hypothetical protein
LREKYKRRKGQKYREKKESKEKEKIRDERQGNESGKNSGDPKNRHSNFRYHRNLEKLGSSLGMVSTSLDRFIQKKK